MTSATTAWVLLVSGLVGTSWSGKNFASTLVAVSSAAWQLPRRATSATVRIIVTTAGLVALLIVATSVLAAVRRAAGLAIATTSLAAVLAVYSAAWFVISLGLPRTTSDPGAVLPGAALVGVTLTVMQGATQLYLAPRLDARSELLGGLGIAAVAMGWLFLASRVMVTSLTVNAVVYERLGSVSQLIFDVPGIRWIPHRFPSVARYFDLDVEPDTESPNDRAS